MINIIANYIGQPSIIESEPDLVTPVAFGANTVMFFDPSRTKTMFKEVSTTSASANNVGVPVTEANTDDDLVGFIHDLGQHALYLTNTGGSTTRFVLKSDATRNSYWELDATKALILQNSTSILRNMHKASPTFGWAGWFKKNVDGTVMYYCSSTNAATSRGFEIRTTAANKLSFLLSDGDGGYMVNFTSTASILVADLWIPFRLNSNGTTLTCTIGNNANETGAISGGNASTAANNLTIGRRSDATSAFNGGIGAFILNNTPITDVEWTDWKTYNPIRQSNHFKTTARKYDYNDPTYLFSDTSGTVPVVVDDPVAFVRNKAVTTNFGAYELGLNQATLANRPLYKTSIQNGRNGLLYDGSNDNLAIGQEPIRGGRFTWYFVFSNNDNTLGSHIFSGAGNCYLVATGNDYDETSPRIVAHQNVGVVGEAENIGLTADSVNVVAVRLNGTERKLFNMSGESDTQTNSLQWSPTNFGVTNNGNTGWNHDGYALYYEQVFGYETDAEIIANINTLKTAYGL
jgi:hypothetical protein